MSKWLDILAVLPPKVCLEEYWEVLNRIDWKLLLFHSGLTVEEVKNSIERQLREIDNPYYKRKLQRAKEKLEETVKLLEKAGLVRVENNRITKSVHYSEFISFIKNNIKTSVNRWIAWVVWYFQQNKLEKFKLNDILNEISYSEKYLIKELKYVRVWDGKKWRPLLKKKDGRWEVRNTPHFPNRSFLLLGLNEKICAAVKYLLEKGILFDENTLLKTLENLKEKR